jgi:hypothetical protein
MKWSFAIILIATLLLSSCGNPTDNGQVYVGAEAGPIDVIISVDNNGKVAVSGGIAPKFKVGLGPVELKVGIQKTIELTSERPYYLFVIWQDETGEVQREEYEIGKTFHVIFTQNEQIQEIQGNNNSVIVVVNKSETGFASSDLPTAQVIAPTSPPSPSNILSPSMGNFSACLEPCNGSNSTSNFPEAITKLHVEWDYENIPYGARYIRKWTMDGNEWIRYDCAWSGNESGRDSVKLTEPKGLHSGSWELTISVNNETLLREQINISGNWDYWDPAGTLNSCYGTTD